MVTFPLDILELGLLLCITALLLIFTFGLLSTGNRPANVLIDMKKLRNVTILFSILFLTIVAWEVFNSL